MKWEKRYINSPAALKLLGGYLKLNNSLGIDFKIGYNQEHEIGARKQLAEKHSGGVCWSLVSLFHEIVAVGGEAEFENILYGECAYLRPFSGQVQPIQLNQVDDSYFNDYRQQVRENSLFQAEIGESSKGSFSDQQSYSVLDHYLNKRMDKQARMVEDYGESRRQNLHKHHQWLRSGKLKFNNDYSAFYKNFPTIPFSTSDLKKKFYLELTPNGSSTTYFNSEYFARRTRSYQKKMYGVEYQSKLGESYNVKPCETKTSKMIGGKKLEFIKDINLSDNDVMINICAGLAELLTELDNAKKENEIGFGVLGIDYSYGKTAHVIGLMKKNKANNQASTYYLFDPNYGLSSKVGGFNELVLLLRGWLLMENGIGTELISGFGVSSYRLIKSKL